MQGAGSRLAFSFGRDGAFRASAWLSAVNKRFRTPVNALLVGAVISLLFVPRLLPAHEERLHRVHHVSGEHDALQSLVSFGVSGIYLSFLLAVIAAIVARAGAGYPREASASADGAGRCPSSPRLPGADAAQRRRANRPDERARLFNLDWITLFVMASSRPSARSTSSSHDRTARSRDTYTTSWSPREQSATAE